MPWEGRKQELCFPSRSLHCPQVQCHLILAVLKYIERFILKLPGLLPTQCGGPAASLLYGGGRKETQAVNESLFGGFVVANYVNE